MWVARGGGGRREEEEGKGERRVRARSDLPVEERPTKAGESSFLGEAAPELGASKDKGARKQTGRLASGNVGGASERQQSCGRAKETQQRGLPK